MNICCNVNMRCRLVTLTSALLIALMMGTWYPTAARANCDVTSNGSGGVGRITKFTPSSCNIENSAIFESSGKVGIGTTTPAATLDVNGGAVLRGPTGVGLPASGGFEFQVSAPNQVGLLVQGPASAVGAGLDLKTTGTGGLQWEILDTGAAAAQGANKLNIRNVNTAADVLTIAADGNVGVGETNPTSPLEVNGNSANPALKAINNATSGTLPEALFGTNNSAAPTLEVINNDTSGALASFQSANGAGCFIDSGANLTCTGSITGGVAWHGRNGRLHLPAGPVRASAVEPGPVVAPQPMASGEWFEDFGSGWLKNGVGSVALNSAFVQAIIGNGYHLFFTPYADCKGLYVTRKTPTSFDVRELGGGHSSVDFDYRVVGHGEVSAPIPGSLGSNLATAVVSRRPAS